MKLPLHLLLCILAATSSAALTAPCLADTPAAQAGDKKGEIQPQVDKGFDVPPAPALTPELELASFEIQPGYRIECVASDPLIHDPVDIAWDAQGRLWVVEMSQLMLDADGTDELAPKCSIAVLTDSDSDGVFDQRQDFLQNLVLPRSICFVAGGVLVLTPPELLFVQDLDGDGVGETKTVIDTGFEAGLSNPEHAPNAMTLGIDNWVYLCNHGKRYRLVNGTWRSQAVPRAGQWGMGEDIWGRRCYDYNSTPVHVDRVPVHYLLRNANYGRAAGSNARLATGKKVWSARLNTGVNRGYRNGTLNANGKLANYTSACGPDFFTGSLLQKGDVNDAFVCEPAANMVRHLDVTESDGLQRGENRYESIQSEFLRSTDERFRPVNIANGPDGALYIVDLYRGILQHRVFMTSYLRRQVEERGLDKHTGLGRIWRVVRDDVDADTAVDADAGLNTNAATKPFDLLHQSTQQLMIALGSENGWTRLTAQRLLIGRGSKPNQADPVQYQLLRQMAADHPNPLARLHAAWTMEGLHGYTADFIAGRLAVETHPKLIAQWIRISEPLSESTAIWQEWQKQVDSPHAQIRWQLAHSLGESANPGAIIMMKEMLALHLDDNILRSGILSGIQDREHLLLNRVSRDERLQTQSESSRDLYTQLGKCIAKGGNLDRMDRTWKRILGLEFDWMKYALLQGMISGLPKKKGNKRYNFIERESKSLLGLATSEDKKLAELANKVSSVMKWNFKPGAVPIEELPEPQRASIARGKIQYSQTCAACHQLDGKGLAGLAPPFEGSEWLQKPDKKLAKIALEGISGKITVNGQEWDLLMPGWAHLSDQQLADIMNYIFMQWSTKPRMLKPEFIGAQRDK